MVTPDGKQAAQVVLGHHRDVDRREQQQREDRNQNRAAHEPVLLAEHGEDKVVVDDRARQEAQLVERVRRLEPLPGESARSNGDERLVDGPAGILGIAAGVEEREDTVLLISLQAKVHDERHHGDAKQDEADKIALRDATDEEHAKHHRDPDQRGAEVRLDQNQDPRRADDRAARDQPKERMQVLELAEEQRQDQDAGQQGQLRGLEVHELQIQPASRSVTLLAEDHGRDQPEKPQKIKRQRPPANPSIVDEGNDHEKRDANEHPLDLVAPEIVRAHPGRAVDRVDPIAHEGQHQAKQEPIEAEQFSKKWMHSTSR